MWHTKQVISNTDQPFVVIDNWFDENELKSVWAELNHFISLPTNIIERSENGNDVARYEDGKSKSYCNRFYLEKIYSEQGKDFSPIIGCKYKHSTDDFKKSVSGVFKNYMQFNQINDTYSILSYYENDDHYDTHYDNSVYTTVVWLFNEPKKFEGGDFEFSRSKQLIKIKNNRAVIFPGCYEHKVKPVSMSNDEPFGYGRFTISYFHYVNPMYE